MHIQISLDGTETPTQLTAIGALIDSLAGRSPAKPGVVVGQKVETAVPVVTAAAPHVPTPAPVMPEPIVTAAGNTFLPALTADQAFGGYAAMPDAPPPPPVPSATIVPPPPVPSATIVPPPPPGPGGQVEPSSAPVDVKGVPWDIRIHAETKATNKDGTWRQRRNLNPEVLATVMAELMGGAPAPLPPTTTVPAAAATALPVVAATTATDVPPPPLVAAVAPPPPPAPFDPKAPPHPDWLRLIKDCTAAGQTFDGLNPIAQQIGLTRFMDLMQRVDLIPTVRQLIGLAE